MDKPALEFWFDFGSSYSYLTSTRIERVCAAAGLSLVWRPFLLGPIFREQGMDTSPFNLNAARGRYMWTEMIRRSAKYGLVKYRKPTEFPRNGLLAARIALAAGAEPWLGEFNAAVFRANFEQDADIAGKAVIGAILRDLGQEDDRWIASAETTDAKAALRAQTERARELGIFGAPTFVISGELFFGDDHLEEATDRARVPGG